MPSFSEGSVGIGLILVQKWIALHWVSLDWIGGFQYHKNLEVMTREYAFVG